MKLSQITRDNGERELLTPQEVADAFGVSRSWLFLAVRDGRFPEPIKVGERIRRWDATKLQAWIDSGCERIGR